MLNSTRYQLRPELFVALCSLVIFGLAYFSVVDATSSDPILSLLTSQAIIEHQTVRLDEYKDKIDNRYHFDYNYRVRETNGHYYYFFPLAPSVFSVPFVWVANLLGYDMVVHDNEYALQSLLSALSCALIFVILFNICACYLQPAASLVITAVSILGSGLVSTLGTALWNMNFALVFVLLSLLLLVRYDTGRSKGVNPYLLGFLLFAGFWTRPTVAPFILVVFGYIFLRQRQIFLKLMLASLALFLLFVGWSWLTFDQWLSDYYLPTRLTQVSTFWEALYGNAFSPARGLLIFSPFFILTILGAIILFPNLKKYDLFWFSLVWFGLYYIAVSRKNEDWWGGHQFGPRLLIDGMPALILITIFLWREISARSRPVVKTIAAIAFIALGIFGIFINSYQGLYNPYTNQWNKNPNIDRNPEYLFDWKYPQFLASAESLYRRRLEHQQAKLNAYALGDTITFESNEAVFWDWQDPETGWRWTDGPTPRIVFKVGLDATASGQRYVMELLGTSLNAQTVSVALNDTELGQVNLEAFSGSMPAAQAVIFDGGLLEEGELNAIDFHIPQAAQVEGEAARTAGMAFVSLKIYPFLAESEGVYFYDSDLLPTGFSHAEKGWRWTDGVSATVIYPSEAVEADQDYVLELVSGALDAQTVEVALNGKDIGQLRFSGFEPAAQELAFNGALLKDQGSNVISFLIPNATVPEGDSRQLGLAFVSLKISPVEP